jgi:membrane associated rhomboid family serine protease
MPSCLKCGAELPVNEEGVAPVLCDSCAGVASKRAHRSLGAVGTMSQYPVTSALLAINVAVYVVMVFSGGLSALGGFNGKLLVQWGGNYGPYTVSGDFWRLITANFVHANLLHLGMNMWILWLLGRLCERLFGRWQTAAIYLLTGFGGSLLSIAYDPTRLEVGASGAIFGLGGALLTGLKFGNISVSAGERKAILSTVTIFTIISFYLGTGGNTDNMCHLGGFFTGLVIGLPLATSLSSSPTRTALFHAITLGITAVLMGAGVAELVQTRKIFSVQRALSHGDVPAAIRMLEATANSNPNDPDTQFVLGELYERSGNFDKAIAAFERAAKLDASSVDFQLALGDVYTRSQQRDKAIAAYEQALKLDPNQTEAQEALKTLRGSN